MPHVYIKHMAETTANSTYSQYTILEFSEKKIEKGAAPT